MNFPFYIAKRYLFAKSSNNAINIITMIASFGVVVGSMALFIILSGFSGLRTFSFSLLDMSDPDIKVTSKIGKTFKFSDSLESKISANDKIIHFSKVLEERVFLKNKDKEHIAFIKGVDVNYNNVTSIDSAMMMGDWLDFSYKNTAVVGAGISHKLSLGVLNYDEGLEIYIPKVGTGFLGPNSYRSITARVVGIYSGTEEFENKYVFVNLTTAQELMNYESDIISALEIDLDENTNADDFAEVLRKSLGTQFKVQTKIQQNELFYKVINTENFVSYLIFTLIVIIAMFNVVGAIIMMIIDKRKNLKTLFSLGATIKEVKQIFVLQGVLLTTYGMLIGVALASLLIVIQNKFEIFMITRTIAYPVEFQLSNLLIVIATIFTLGFLASKIASSRISINFIEK